MADSQDFTMKSGDTKELVIPVYDLSGGTVNVTGGSAVYGLAESPFGSPLITKTSAAGGVTLSGSTVTVFIEATDTEALDGRYYQECEVVDGNSDVYTILTGYVTISPDIV